MRQRLSEKNVRADPARGPRAASGRRPPPRAAPFSAALRVSSAALAVLLLRPALTASAAPVYVYERSDGSVTFSSRPPPAGVKAEVFTARRGTYSHFRIGPVLQTAAAAKRYHEVIVGAARRHEVDPALVKAVIHAESAFNPRAVSRKGARGLMQLMPGTAKDLGVRDSFTAVDNVDGGVRYLAQLLRKYRGNLTFTLAAYNAGEGTVERYRGVPPFAETRDYVRKVLALRDRYRSG